MLKPETGITSVHAPLEKIIPCSENNRRVLNALADKDLAESIAKHGQLQPGIARPHPEKKGHYDLRAGARRFRACQAAGLKTMWLEVWPMTDAEAMTVTLLENLKRADLHPLDQARGIQELLKKSEVKSVEDAARLLNMTPNETRRRLQLLSLTKEWQRALNDPKCWLNTLPLTHLQEVSRLPATSQNDVLETMCRGDSEYFADASLAHFRRWIASWLSDLTAVPWDSDDADLLPDAGPCSTCKKRAKADSLLWTDLELPTAGACLDAECHQRKTNAWYQRRTDQIRQETGKAPLCGVFGKSGSKLPVQTDTFRSWEYEKAKKTDPGAVPVIRIDTEKPGDVVWMKKCKSSASTSDKPKRDVDPATGKAKPLPMKERREQLQARRDKWVIGEARLWLRDKFVPNKNDVASQTTAELGVDSVVALVRAFGTAAKADSRFNGENDWAALAKWDKTPPGQNATLLLMSVAEVLQNRLTCLSLDEVPGALAELNHMASLFPIPLDELRKKAEQEIPTPKSWAGESGEEGPALAGTKSGSSPVDQARRETIAQRLEGWAEGLTPQIVALRSPRQDNTPKRLRQARQARIEADNLERGQRALKMLARAWREGVPSEPLSNLRSKKDILQAVRHRVASPSYYHIVDTGEYANDDPASKALQALIIAHMTDADRAALAEAARRSELDQKLTVIRLQKNDGYYPTPPSVAEHVVKLAEIKDGDVVLEPSAGTGELADAVRRAHPVCEVRCVELRPQFVEILRLRDFRHVTNADFLECQGLTDFDRIVMNPPFEKEQDCVHVRHAFALLKPGGRLVSVMSAGIAQRQNGQAAKFREWLKPLPHKVYRLPDGSFKASNTSVSAILVCIDKPAA